MNSAKSDSTARRLLPASRALPVPSHRALTVYGQVTSCGQPLAPRPISANVPIVATPRRAAILLTSNCRIKATPTTVITLRMRPAGPPEALQTWFYPKQNWGQEGLHTADREFTRVQATNTPALALLQRRNDLFFAMSLFRHVGVGPQIDTTG